MSMDEIVGVQLLNRVLFSIGKLPWQEGIVDSPTYCYEAEKNAPRKCISRQVSERAICAERLRLGATANGDSGSCEQLAHRSIHVAVDG
jgi:hypothetical protein